MKKPVRKMIVRGRNGKRRVASPAEADALARIKQLHRILDRAREDERRHLVATIKNMGAELAEAIKDSLPPEICKVLPINVSARPFMPLLSTGPTRDWHYVNVRAEVPAFAISFRYAVGP